MRSDDRLTQNFLLRVLFYIFNQAPTLNTINRVKVQEINLSGVWTVLKDRLLILHSYLYYSLKMQILIFFLCK